MFSISRGAALRWLTVFSVLCSVLPASAADSDGDKPQYGVAKPLGDKFGANLRVDSQQSLLLISNPPQLTELPHDEEKIQTHAKLV